MSPFLSSQAIGLTRTSTTRHEDGTVIDGFGRKIGEVSEDGTITDNDGVKLGNVSEDGSVTDSNDREVGNVSIAHNDDIYLAGGAALLLLLKPK